MKRIALALMLSLFATQTVLADCLPAYQAKVEQMEGKRKKWRNIGGISSGTVGALSGAFWGYMGVVMVGPAGILIGAQFALAAAIPVGLPFFIYNYAKKRRTKDYYAIAQILSDDDDNYTKRTKKIIKKMMKKMDIDEEEKLENHLKVLSESEELCDGTVTGDKGRPLARPIHIWKYRNR